MVIADNHWNSSIEPFTRRIYVSTIWPAAIIQQSSSSRILSQMRNTKSKSNRKFLFVMWSTIQHVVGYCTSETVERRNFFTYHYNSDFQINRSTNSFCTLTENRFVRTPRYPWCDTQDFRYVLTNTCGLFFIPSDSFIWLVHISIIVYENWSFLLDKQC